MLVIIVLRKYGLPSRLALVVVVSLMSAGGTLASYDAEFQRLLSAPDDPVLNRQFAVSAEARGELRHALAALERARTADPNNAELVADYERIRRKILPAVTAITVQAGANYASNPRELPNGSARKRDDGIADAAVTVEDERTIAGLRIRSIALAAGQWHDETGELSSGRVAVESGPVFMLSRDAWLQVAPGASAAFLDDYQLYSEASAAATIGGVFDGLSQTVTARYGWRDGNNDVQYSDAQVLEVLGRFVVSPSLFAGDYLYFQPGYRHATHEDDFSASTVLPTVIGPSTLVSRDISPPGVNEWGARLSYFFPVQRGVAYLGAGLSIFERDFDSSVLDPGALALGVPVATGEKRQDLFIEPTAHLILPDLLAPNVDLRADYRLEDNRSNDGSREYRNHVAGLRVVGRF